MKNNILIRIVDLIAENAAVFLQLNSTMHSHSKTIYYNTAPPITKHMTDDTRKILHIAND